jgi:hypothetical protein
MGEDNYTFEDMTAILPELWREKAKEPGALQLAREIKTPEDLPLLSHFLSSCNNFKPGRGIFFPPIFYPPQAAE